MQLTLSDLHCFMWDIALWEVGQQCSIVLSFTELGVGTWSVSLSFTLWSICNIQFLTVIHQVVSRGKVSGQRPHRDSIISSRWRQARVDVGLNKDDSWTYRLIGFRLPFSHWQITALSSADVVWRSDRLPKRPSESLLGEEVCRNSALQPV